MKVYFQLTEEYNSCIKDCPRYDKESEQNCDNICGNIYDKYALILQDRYKEQPEKLNEVVTGARGFDTKRREHTKGIFYKVFGRTFSGKEDE